MSVKNSFENYRQSYPDGDQSQHTWGGRLKIIAQTIPEITAFIQGEQSLTWKEFDQQVNRLANALLDMGVKKEERFAIMSFNRIEWMEAYFALSRIGAVPVNVNPRFVASELKYILEDSDSVGIFIEEDELPHLEKILPELELLRYVIVFGARAPEAGAIYSDLIKQYPSTEPELPWKVTNSDFAFLFYTGGTTGYPKGTVWDYKMRVRGLDVIMLSALGPFLERLPDLNPEAFERAKVLLPPLLPSWLVRSQFFKRLITRARGSPILDALFLRLLGSPLNYKLMGGKLRLIVAAQLFHGAAYETNFSLIGATGGTSIYLTQRHPFNPQELWETVEKKKANLIVIVGDAYAIPMLEELESKDYDTSSLAAIISSGVRWSPHIKKRFLERIPGAVLLDELGSTEVSTAFSQVSAPGDSEIGALKIRLTRSGLYPVRAINPLTGEDARPGERAELAYGGFTALGYWKDPEKTAKSWKVIDGERWFFVGDEGVVDEEGYFHFIGRGPTVINTGGEKVYPEEVEEVIKTHPQVKDVGVCGVPHPRWGEAVTALVEPKPGADLTPEEIIKFCEGKLAGYKKPKYVVFVEQIPRSPTGKLERRNFKPLAQKLLGIKEE